MKIRNYRPVPKVEGVADQPDERHALPGEKSSVDDGVVGSQYQKGAA